MKWWQNSNLRHKDSISSNRVFFVCFIFIFQHRNHSKKPTCILCFAIFTCKLEALSHFHTFHILTFPRLWFSIWSTGLPLRCLFFQPSTPLHKGIDSICSIQFIHPVTILMKFLVWSHPQPKKGEIRKVEQSVARVILGMMVSLCGKLFS